MNGILRKGWRPFFRYDWKFGLFLILLFGIPRFFIVLQSYLTKSYAAVAFLFLIMWFTPLIFLTKEGRRYIGMKRPDHSVRLVSAFIAGCCCCAVLFGLFLLLFGKTTDNAFVYIGSGNYGTSIPGQDRILYFWLAAIPGMIFSPIGEELLYRGIIHGSFVERFGEKKAAVFDSLAFAITHIAHFGIVYIGGIRMFLPLPAFVWTTSMFCSCIVFSCCKWYSCSIWGAVLAHSGFNFAMMYFIFFAL